MHKSSAVLVSCCLLLMFGIPAWDSVADRPESEKVASTSSDAESLDVRHARAHVKLAKLDLRRVIEANERAPVFSADLIELLRLHLAVDEAHLKQCLKGDDADAHHVCLRSAEAAVEVAKLELVRRQNVHQNMPTSASADNLERAQVVSEIAHLNLERASRLKSSESVLKHLQMQIDELRHQVLELQMKNAKS